MPIEVENIVMDIADLLKIARYDLAYSKIIQELLPTVFVPDLMSPRDMLFVTIHRTCFYESLLIVSSLIDSKKKRKNTPFSFYSWNSFITIPDNKNWLDTQVKYFSKGPLGEMRDKVVAHIDQEGENNQSMFLWTRSVKMIERDTIVALWDFQNGLIEKFYASCNMRDDWFKEAEVSAKASVDLLFKK